MYNVEPEFRELHLAIRNMNKICNEIFERETQMEYEQQLLQWMLEDIENEKKKLRTI